MKEEKEEDGDMDPCWAMMVLYNGALMAGWAAHVEVVRVWYFDPSGKTFVPFLVTSS
jgi:hypothetical protein